jgi:hypothetical protein
MAKGQTVKDSFSIPQAQMKTEFILALFLADKSRRNAHLLTFPTAKGNKYLHFQFENTREKLPIQFFRSRLEMNDEIALSFFLSFSSTFLFGFDLLVWLLKVPGI